MDITRFDDVVRPFALDSEAVVKEINLIIQLVVSKLGEVGSRHYWEAIV